MTDKNLEVIVTIIVLCVLVPGILWYFLGLIIAAIVLATAIIIGIIIIKKLSEESVPGAW